MHSKVKGGTINPMKKTTGLAVIMFLAFIATLGARRAEIIDDKIAVPGFFLFFLLMTAFTIASVIHSTRRNPSSRKMD